MIQDWKQRFVEAYKRYQDQKFPMLVKDQGYVMPKYPDVRKANGLTNAIIKFLTWQGHYANRINTMGRPRVEKVQMFGGRTFEKLTWQKGTTKRGTGDIDSIIQGKPVKWEVKINSDRQSDHQKLEQDRITSAGGYYFIVKTIDHFFMYYDELLGDTIL